MKIIGETPLRILASGDCSASKDRSISCRESGRVAPKNRIWRIVGTSRTGQIHRADSLHPTLTTQQIFQIARIFDPTVEDDLAEGLAAWKNYQSTRKRDAVYEYGALVGVDGIAGSAERNQ